MYNSSGVERAEGETVGRKGVETWGSWETIEGSWKSSVQVAEGEGRAKKGNRGDEKLQRKSGEFFAIDVQYLRDEERWEGSELVDSKASWVCISTKVETRGSCSDWAKSYIKKTNEVDERNSSSDRCAINSWRIGSNWIF